MILLTTDPVGPGDDTASLAAVEPGRTAVVVRVDDRGPEGQRLLDLGFTPRTEIQVLKRAPLGDPVVYGVRGTRMCLRRSEAERVRVRPL